MKSPALFFILKIALTIQDLFLLWFHTNVGLSVTFCEKYLCSFDRDYMTYQPPKIVPSTLSLDFLVTFVAPLSSFCFIFSKTVPMCL